MDELRPTSHVERADKRLSIIQYSSSGGGPMHACVPRNVSNKLFLFLFLFLR
jgi:hypothetical protein